MPLISCRNAAYAYDGRVVVSSLNFAVNSGDYLCIVGENGSGKSTLIMGLLGLKIPSAGEVETGNGLQQTEIGYLPQQTTAQKDFPSSVYEVVLSGRLAARGVKPFYTRRDKETADENMERLGIGELRGRCYRELSGGQQQRTLLARALCAAKKLILLDEPVASLDPEATRDLYSLIGQINRETGIAVIMVSHDIQGAVKNASHILHLKNKQVFFGTRGDYLASNVGKSYIGGDFCL